MSVRFSNKLIAELFQPFWAALQAGECLGPDLARVRARRGVDRSASWRRHSTWTVELLNTSEQAQLAPKLSPGQRICA
jgi:hypothetical protein